MSEIPKKLLELETKPEKNSLPKILLFSAVLHGLALSYPEITTALSEIGDAMNEVRLELRDRLYFQEQRRELIENARLDIANGRFHLGTFILSAERIDAESREETIDTVRLESKYQQLLNNLRSRLREGTAPEDAIGVVLKNYSYQGINENFRMSDFLLNDGGSCSGISATTSALLYDAGYEDRVFLRYYSGDENSSGHRAVTFLAGDGREIDLQAGDVSDGRGTRIAAEQLVELYAAEHDLDTRYTDRLQDSSIQDIDQTLATDTFATPKTNDIYLGFVPLFRSSALATDADQTEDILGNTEGSGGEGPVLTESSNMRLWAFPLTIFPEVEERSDGDEINVEVQWGKSEEDLEAISDFVSVVEEEVAGFSEPNETRLLLLGYLAGAYSISIRQFQIAGNFAIVRHAEEQRDRVILKAEELFEQLESDPEFIENLRFSFDSPLLINEIDMGMAISYLSFLGERGLSTIVRFYNSHRADLSERDAARIIEMLFMYPGYRNQALSFFENQSFGTRLLVADWLNSDDFESSGNDQLSRILGIIRRLSIEGNNINWTDPFSQLQQEIREIIIQDHLNPNWEQYLLAYVASIRATSFYAALENYEAEDQCSDPDINGFFREAIAWSVPISDASSTFQQMTMQLQYYGRGIIDFPECH